MSSQNVTRFEVTEFMEDYDDEPETDYQNDLEDEIDIQRAVVEELANEKAEIQETLREREKELASLRLKAEEIEKQSLADKNALDELRKKFDALAQENGELKTANAALEAARNEEQIEKTQSEIASLNSTIAAHLASIASLEEQVSALADKAADTSADTSKANAIALLDRAFELPDNFLGETRDHVLEVIKAARDQAETEGRVRRSQILESVLVANDPVGNLATARAEIEKLFADNGHIINSTVLSELERRGISHKNGEEYLLPSEILLRNF